MKNSNENTIFKTRNIKVTNLNIILYGKSYSISDTTSALIVTKSSNIVSAFSIIAGIIGLLIIGFSLAFSINFDLMPYSIIGIILIGGAMYGIKTSKPTTYEVQINYKSKNKSIFESKNQSLAKNIVNAINEAINNKVKNPLTGKEDEKRKARKYGIEVIVCPACNTINSLSFTTCNKCFAPIEKVNPIKNPYL